MAELAQERAARQVGSSITVGEPTNVFLHAYEIDVQHVLPDIFGDEAGSEFTLFAEDSDRISRALEATKGRGVLPYRNAVEDVGSISFVIPKHMTREGGRVKHLGSFSVTEMLEMARDALSEGDMKVSMAISSTKAAEAQKSMNVISPAAPPHAGVSSKRLLEAAEQTAEAVAGGTRNSRALRASAAAASIIRRRL